MNWKKAFLLGFVVGIVVGVLFLSILPSILVTKPQGFVKVGSVSYDGLKVTVYVNFTKVKGIPEVDTVMLQKEWSYGLPGGTGVGYCKLVPSYPSNMTSR